MSRVISWFSCGATSAISAKLAVDKYHDRCSIVYCDTGGEHKSNKKFLKDVERWLGRKVIILKNEKYTDHFDVFEKTKYLAGVYGARCTIELKKKLREDFQRHDDIHIFGFDVGERNRMQKLKDNFPELNLEFNLIEKGLSKSDCLALLERQGIELPTMYKLGYGHNNCIGCPKGQSGYWNKIRVDFPDIFDRMSKIERKLNVAINKSYAGDGERKRVFLDELDSNVGRIDEEPVIDCSLFCQIAEQNFHEPKEKHESHRD